MGVRDKRDTLIFGRIVAIRICTTNMVSKMIMKL